MVFACIRNEGLKRLDGEGIVDLAGVKTKGVRRGARRVVGVLNLANVLELHETSQRKAVAIASVADLAKEKSIRAVAIASSGRASKLPIAETLTPNMNMRGAAIRSVLAKIFSEIDCVPLISRSGAPSAYTTSWLSSLIWKNSSSSLPSGSMEAIGSNAAWLVATRTTIRQPPRPHQDARHALVA
jgi:hypothetical protein